MDPRPDVISTYRMLRLALAGMAFAVLLSAGLQTARQHCVLTSVSAYWYTPSRTVFVSCLVAIGVCLVALRGGTWTENLLLNLAGMLAPVVAVVPTQLGRPEDLTCLGAAARQQSSGALIDNGLAVYLALAVLSFGVAVVSSARRSRLAHGAGAVPGAVRVARLVGLVLAASVLVGLAGWRLLDDRGFVTHVHTVAAATMFGCVAGVVAFRTRPLAAVSRRWDGYHDDVLDAALQRRSGSAYSRTYAAIAVFMLTSVVVGFTGASRWAHREIVVETLLLLSFIAFWLLQTYQLRQQAPAAAQAVEAAPSAGTDVTGAA